jgi:cytochrome P450
VLLQPKKFPKKTFGAFAGTFLGRFLGENILFANGEDWRSQRYIINPAFYDIESFYELFDELIEKCQSNWEADIRSNISKKLVVKVRPSLTNLTIDILGRTIFGHKFGALEGKFDNYVESYNKLLDNMHLGSLLQLLIPLIFKIPIKDDKHIEFHLNRFNSMIYKVIRKRKRKIIERGNNYVGEKSLLDLMIESQDDETGTRLTETQIRDNIVCFFVAGQEPTASSLGFALYALGKYQSMQEKVLHEIEQVCGIATPTYEQIYHLDYLHDFVRETQRLFTPIGGITPRYSAEDTEIGGFHIPKGTIVSTAVWSIHHAEESYGPTVNEFRPERWQGEEGKSIHKFAYIVYSAGPRVCIGNNFSLLAVSDVANYTNLSQQKLFLVKLLQKFKVDLHPGYTCVIEEEGSLHHMEKGFEIILTPRNKEASPIGRDQSSSTF